MTRADNKGHAVADDASPLYLLTLFIQQYKIMSKSQNFKNEPNKGELYVIINIEDGVKYDLRIPKHVCMVSLIHCNPFSPTYRYKRSPKPELAWER